MKRTLFVLAAAALTLGVAGGLTRLASPTDGSPAAATTLVVAPADPNGAVVGADGPGGVVQAVTERPEPVEQPDAPISLGKLKITIDMSPAAVKARASTRDVLCPGSDPCGP